MNDEALWMSVALELMPELDDTDTTMEIQEDALSHRLILRLELPDSEKFEIKIPAFEIVRMDDPIRECLSRLVSRYRLVTFPRLKRLGLTARGTKL